MVATDSYTSLVLHDSLHQTAFVKYTNRVQSYRDISFYR